MKSVKEGAFWLAVGLAGVATLGILKVLAGRVKLPSGLTETIAAL